MEVYVRLGQPGGESYQSTKGNVAPMVERQFEGLGGVGSSPTVTTKKESNVEWFGICLLSSMYHYGMWFDSTVFR